MRKTNRRYWLSGSSCLNDRIVSTRRIMAKLLRKGDLMTYAELDALAKPGQAICVQKRNPLRYEISSDDRFDVVVVPMNETGRSDAGAEQSMTVTSIARDSKKNIVLCAVDHSGGISTVTVLKPGVTVADSPATISDVYKAVPTGPDNEAKAVREREAENANNAEMRDARTAANNAVNTGGRKSRITRKKRKSTRRTRKH